MAVESEVVMARARAAQYVRMSTDKQKYSTQNQKDAIASYAAHRGLTIVRTYSDEGRSGLNISRRDALRALIEDVKSGNPGFEFILVYDVSRWGRFQDADESAYYEFICKEAGVRVLYCAELFENDGSLSSTILKSLKRAMAGEYSRELSNKVFMGQSRITRMGFWRGGFPGYGLRRLLLDERGKVKAQLEFGQQKSLQTDRVVIIHGPPLEVETVRRIFHSFAVERKTAYRIAAELNLDQIPTLRGGPWGDHSVLKVLKNERYLGHIIFNRTSEKLGRKRVLNPPEMWIRKDHAFEPMVKPDLFEQARKILQERRNVCSEKEMLERLAALQRENGRLTRTIIDACEDVPAVWTLQRHYGSLLAAYRLIDYQPQRLVVRSSIATTRRSILQTAATEIGARIEELGGRASISQDNRLLTIDDEFSISLCAATPNRLSTRIRWYANVETKARSDLTLVIRTELSGTKIDACYLVPTVALAGVKYKRICLSDKIFVGACRYTNLDAFCRMCVGLEEERAA
ncbi:MAG: recombinase family protein [Bradyrhizobium sp.]|uniref:recombinase family protein n=1 Tax=Bradyrhizobium sp. TaxID=376 RepID=UPI001DB231CC|nr:recombinase family protein [Bradyrhizobium sp.]MBV9559202.1 recombinase family protein [Bradyrhizobium sp.]